jgi:hypothetical protein
MTDQELLNLLKSMWEESPDEEELLEESYQQELEDFLSGKDEDDWDI